MSCARAPTPTPLCRVRQACGLWAVASRTPRRCRPCRGSMRADVALQDAPLMARKLRPLRAGPVLAAGEAAAASVSGGAAEQHALAHPFGVLTWNMLADGLAQSGDFVRAPPAALEWSHRLPLIVAQVAAAAADLVCLQEANHFDALEAELAALGYEGAWLPKHPAPAERFGAPPDGVAVFWRPARFDRLGDPLGAPYANGAGRPAAQGLLCVALRDRECGRRLLVANTHLKAKAGGECEAARASQVAQLLQRVRQQRQRAAAAASAAAGHEGATGNGGGAAKGGGGEEEVAVVVCGDFNTTPDTQPCQAMVAPDSGLGLQSLWDVPWRDAAAGGITVDDDATPTAAAKSTPEFTTWKFRSGRAGGRGGGGLELASPLCSVADASRDDADAAGVRGGASSPSPPPPDHETRRTIDFVFFSGRQLAAAARWPMLDQRQIGAGALPSHAYPSDHVAVVAQLAWRL